MLTDSEKEIVKNLYVDQKFTVKQIVKYFNNPKITEASLNHVIQRNGWTRKTIAQDLTQEEKEIILKKLNEGLNCGEIGKILGYSYKRINAFIRKQGLHSSIEKRSKLTEAEIEDIKTMYNNKRTGKEILKKYRDKIYCENTIIKIAREEGCVIRPNGKIPRTLNESFFETIDTEEKAYFLGWMLSDGYVVKPKNKGYVIGIDLQIEDKYILEHFREVIKLDKSAPLLDQVRRNCSANNRIKESYQSRLAFRSNKMAADLSKYGVVPHKSHTVRFPYGVGEEMVHHLIRGLFDGDGCISGRTISFAGNKKMMLDVREILHNSINIAYNMIYDNTFCFHFTFSSKKDVENFYHYLYDNATIFLKRKKERFEKLDFIKQQTH